MNINAERFFALTALLAAPLVTASACVITSSDGDGETSGDTGAASMTASTDPTASTTMTASTDPTVSTTDATTTTPDPDSTGTGTGTDDGTGTGTDDGTGTDTGTTGGVDLGNCCAPAGIIGCEVPEVEACVCAVDPFCCEEEWDAVCAMAVNDNDCGECEFPPQPFDCSCAAVCDGEAAVSDFQVCGGDSDSAVDAGLAACEAEFAAECEVVVCNECDCVTAEIPEIDCK